MATPTPVDTGVDRVVSDQMLSDSEDGRTNAGGSPGVADAGPSNNGEPFRL